MCMANGSGANFLGQRTVLYTRGIRANAKSKATSWAPTHEEEEEEAQVEGCKRHDSDSDRFENKIHVHVSSCICEVVLPLKHVQQTFTYHLHR